MEFYLYSSQDLMIGGNGSKCVEAGNLFQLNIADENVFIYPLSNAGIMIVNRQILQAKQHSQINFYQLNNNAILCEIKPFVTNQNIRHYIVDNAHIKLVCNLNKIYIFYNNEFHGSVDGEDNNIKYEKIIKNKHEYGIIEIFGPNKTLIIFNSEKIIYCGQYIDYENLKEYFQIYAHVPNVFKTGQLIKYDFNNLSLEYKTVLDCGVDYKHSSNGFNVIYFIEAIKSGRFKYAYNKLSYGLKSEITVDTLRKYFKPFDKYLFLNKTQSYITINNNKIVGIYHFELKDDLINNIY